MRQSSRKAGFRQFACSCVYLCNRCRRKQEYASSRNSFFSTGGTSYLQNLNGNFIPAMIRLNHYLRKMGVDLILVRIPSRGDISWDLFAENAPKDMIANPILLEVHRRLLEAGVEIVDPTDYIREHRFRFPLIYWYQTTYEGHPAEGFSRLCAEYLAKKLQRYQFPR